MHIKFLIYLHLKTDFMFKRIITNTIKDLSTTALGAFAGGSDLLEGITHNDKAKIIKGISLIILGMILNTKTKN